MYIHVSDYFASYKQKEHSDFWGEWKLFKLKNNAYKRNYKKKGGLQYSIAEDGPIYGSLLFAITHSIG